MEALALHILLYSTLALMCSSFPADAESSTVMGASSNSFEVTACRKLPSARAMNVCSIDYQVPASIAAMVNIIEYHINGKLMELSESPVYAGCRPVHLEALCAFYFPRCDGPSVVMRSIPNCKERTDQVCLGNVQRLIEAEGTCKLNVTAPLDSCNSLSEYEAYDGFQRCSVVDRSTEVTAWMVEYMKVIDEEWTKKLQDSTLSSLTNQASCHNGVSEYYCQFFGRCTNNGEIELSNSEGSCDDVLGCYTDMTAESLRNTISCSLWPLVDTNPDNPSSSPTEQPAKPTSKSTPQQPSKWPNPFVDGGVSLHSVCWTGVASLIALASSIVLLYM